MGDLNFDELKKKKKRLSSLLSFNLLGAKTSFVGKPNFTRARPKFSSSRTGLLKANPNKNVQDVPISILLYSRVIVVIDLGLTIKAKIHLFFVFDNCLRRQSFMLL